MVERRQALLKLLTGLGEASQFVSVGQFPAVLPGLEVDGLDSIGVPVAPADAKRIIGKASQAPYGLGEATIVDADVRRVWQLEPSQFELRNTAWNEAVQRVVDTVKRDLGIHGKVTAELYKLLVYEKGSFFKPHRDTEKIAGMFATLVVCLPSRHEGGTLILEHDGQTKQIDFGGKTGASGRRSGSTARSAFRRGAKTCQLFSTACSPPESSVFVIDHRSQTVQDTCS